MHLTFYTPVKICHQQHGEFLVALFSPFVHLHVTVTVNICLMSWVLVGFFKSQSSVCVCFVCLDCLSKSVARVWGPLRVCVSVHVDSSRVCVLILFMCPGQWLRHDGWG